MTNKPRSARLAYALRYRKAGGGLYERGNSTWLETALRWGSAVATFQALDAHAFTRDAKVNTP